MFVVRGGFASLGAEFAGVVNQGGVGGDEHSTAGSGDDFVAVEGEDAGATEGSRRLTLVGGPQRFGGVFEQDDAVTLAKGLDGGDVGALAVEVDEDERFGQAITFRAAGEEVGQQVRVHVPGGGVAVYEDGTSADVEDGVDAGGEGEGGDGHFVAGADAEVDEGQVEGGGAGDEGEGVGRAGEGAEFSLEGVYVGAEGGDPIAGEGFLDELLFQAGHVWGGEVDSGHEEF